MVVSRAVPQKAVEFISVLANVSITPVLRVHSTISTLYQLFFLANFSLNGGFCFIGIINVSFTFCFSNMVMFNITKCSDKFLMWLLLSVKAFTAMTEYSRRV